MAAREEVTLVVRARDLTRGVFRNLRRRIGGLRLSLGGLIAGGALGAAARAATEAATEIQAVADQLGISVEEAQALQTIAADINVPFGALANNVQRVGRNFGEAVRGAGPLQEFLELGIPIDQSQFRGALDVFLAVVDAARNSNIELAKTQSIVGGIADSEGLNTIQRLIRGGGNVRVQIDDLAANVARPAAEIAEAVENERQIRRELLELQKEFAQTLTVLLPAVLELTRTVNEVASIVQQFRAGETAEALDRLSDVGTAATLTGGLRSGVRGEGGRFLGVDIPAGQPLGAQLFEANLFLQRLEKSVRDGIVNAQEPILRFLNIENTENTSGRGVFRIGD